MYKYGAAGPVVRRYPPARWYRRGAGVAPGPSFGIRWGVGVKVARVVVQVANMRPKLGQCGHTAANTSRYA